jgi:hypothetical protein
MPSCIRVIGLLTLKQGNLKRGVRQMEDGILMLFTGKDVSGSEGTWSRYYASLSTRGPTSPTFTTGEPTYGTLTDVERWITEDYKIPLQARNKILEQIKLGPTSQGLFINTSPKIRTVAP